MINDNTILSSFNDRPTLLEWLKKVEDALKSDTATAFHVNERGNATLTFSIDFANGTSLESEPIVLQQRESVRSATIRNGHLILTLTNGDELDAGDVKPVSRFEINDSQHLIVYYGDGTNQDLGNIYVGNVTIEGTFKQTLPNYTKPFEFSVSNPIFEVTNVYNRFIVINNILYIIANIKITNTSNEAKPFDRVPTAYVSTSDNQGVYDNVYDIEGNTIGNAQNDNVFIAGDQAILLKGGTNTSAIRSIEQNYYIIVYNSDSHSNKTINVYFEKNNGATDVTLDPGQSIYLSGRIALSLM